ncbi:MAG: acylphosphatase [Phycisphaerae bacterium]|jgi:acylphosphatase
MKRVRVRFVGRVQGVGFRATCRAIAVVRPVTGWVRNEPDGSVLLEAQGDASAVEEFLQAIHDRMTRNIQQADRADVQLATDESQFRVTH